MGDRWRSLLEKICIPVGALVAALVIFGLFCALAGANPLGVYYSIYRAAFGSWSSFQNTLIQASPLMLSALCTALPARLGLVIIGNEGALVLGGLAAVA
ncbi:MAG: ABC transporter permease, partial [Shackletoniella antarctica]